MSEPNIIRTVKNRDNPYTMISRILLNDASLSWEARGVLAYLLDKPDNWIVRFNDLVKKGPGSEDRMRRILKELATHGYLQRECVRGPRGQWQWISLVYETPTLATPAPPAAPYADVPQADLPQADLSDGENRHIYQVLTVPNTDRNNTEREREPPLSALKPFTVTDDLRQWVAQQLAEAGLPAHAVNLDEQTARWHDAPRRHTEGDWRNWIRRAIDWATTHPAEWQHAAPRRPPPAPPSADERAVWDKLSARLQMPLPPRGDSADLPPSTIPEGPGAGSSIAHQATAPGPSTIPSN